jgi:hypothetical protein
MLFILLLLVGLLAHTHDWSVEWIVSMMFVLPIESRIAEVAGLTPHYLLAGHGPAVILLHLYPQTSLMCMAIIPHKRGKIGSSCTAGLAYGRIQRSHCCIGPVSRLPCSQSALNTD